MQTIDLNGIWALRYCDPGEGERLGWSSSGVQGREAIAARVPGCVHLDLTEAGIIGEPLYGTQALDCQWVEEKDWWYSQKVYIPFGFIKDRVELRFGSLDTTADVWLNGQHIGSFNNAFVAHAIDITPFVREGQNQIVVRLDVGLRATEGKETEKYRRMGGSAVDTPRMWIRKPQFTFQWDWAPRLLTCGISRAADLVSFRVAALRDVCLRTLLLPDGSAEVEALLEVENFAPSEQAVTLKVALSDHREHQVTIDAVLLPGLQTLTTKLLIGNPELWWPSPLGEPNLYDCSTRLEADGELLDARRFRYGLREIALKQEPLSDEEGESFTFVVNGQPLYCKGANWSPADSLMTRVSPAKYRELVRMAAEANFNMFRVNGVGTYEDPYFYDLCDEFGILIWQDFTYSCLYYPDDDPDFVAEARREAESVVKSLRNHACLALWCGTNENWWHHFRAIQAGTAADRFYGETLYAGILPEVCAHLDPTRPYWPGSPWGGEDPNSESMGNRHSWDVSILSPTDTERINYENYVNDRGKFISEFGILAPPSVDSLAKFLPASDLHFDSPSWMFHRNTIEIERDTIQAALKKYLRPIEGLALPQYVTYAQLIQAEGLKLAIEHWRRRKFSTSGSLFWNFSDCWGVTEGWTIVDYYLSKKTSYYAVRRAYAPILASIQRTDNYLAFWLINDTLKTADGVLEYGLMELPTSDTRDYVMQANAPANASLQVAEVDISQIQPEHAGRWAAYCRFSVQGQAISHNRLFLAGFHFSALELPQARFNWHINDSTLTLQAHTFVWQVGIQTPDGVRVADNYFDLFPGQECHIQLDGPRALMNRVQVKALNQ